MSLIDEAAASIADAAQQTEPDTTQQWQYAKNGRAFIRLPGVKGWGAMLWRAHDQETVTEAIERRRNEKPKGDKMPRSRKARKIEDRPPVTPQDKSETTRQIREMLEDILCAPAIPFATFGFQWESQHFGVQGQRFAANITAASERNPWLRKKLEAGLQGEQTAIAMLTSINLVTGAVGYVAPPLIKWGILPVPDRVKMMMGVPMPRPPMAPPPPQQRYSPPMTDAMQDVAAMWAQMEQAQNTAGPPTTVTEDGASENAGVQEPA